METDFLKWMQNWAKTQIDGDWEHEHGITIKIIDNPGWEVCVDLVNYEDKIINIDYIFEERDLDDWIGVKISDSYLYLYGDIFKLKKIFYILYTIVIKLEILQKDNGAYLSYEDIKRIIL